MVWLMLLLLLNNLKLWSVMLMEIYAFFQIFAADWYFTFALFGKSWCWTHCFFYVRVRRLICGFAKIAMRMRFIMLQYHHEILYASQVETMSTGKFFIGEWVIAIGTDDIGAITLSITIWIFWLTLLIIRLTINSLMCYSHQRRLILQIFIQWKYIILYFLISFLSLLDFSTNFLLYFISINNIII